jgi:hypothetical protein
MKDEDGTCAAATPFRRAPVPRKAIISAWSADKPMETSITTSCAFCGKPASIPAVPVSACAPCMATLGRWLGFAEETVRDRFWDQRRTVGPIESPEAADAFLRAGVGSSAEEYLKQAVRQGIEFRLSSLGFLAAGLMRVSNRSAGLRAASVFLASLINESLLVNPLINGAAHSCLEALFRPGFFAIEQLNALRDELAVAL